MRLRYRAPSPATKPNDPIFAALPPRHKYPTAATFSLVIAIAADAVVGSDDGLRDWFVGGCWLSFLHAVSAQCPLLCGVGQQYHPASLGPYKPTAPPGDAGHVTLKHGPVGLAVLFFPMYYCRKSSMKTPVSCGHVLAIME